MHRTTTLRLAAVTFAAALALTSCGRSSSTDNPNAAPAAATGSTAAGPGPVAKPAATKLGTVLVDAQGRTLYGFLKDQNGTSACAGQCAAAWPPVMVDGDSVPAGLDPAVFSVVARPDGTKQLKAGTWPLYRFAGDAAAGDVNGQGSGGNWFVVAPNGSLIKGAGTGSAPAATTASTMAPGNAGGY